MRLASCLVMLLAAVSAPTAGAQSTPPAPAEPVVVTTAREATALGIRLIAVMDDSTGAWLENVVIRDTLGHEVRTSKTGLATLNLLSEVYGYYILEARREGYEPRRLKLRADTAKEVMVSLKPRRLSAATGLPAVVVTERASLRLNDGAREGFAQRCDMGARCVGPAEIDRHPTQPIADLLAATDGIHRMCTGSNSIGPDPNAMWEKQLKSSRALRTNALDEVPTCRIEMLESLPKNVAHPYCVPNFLINGIPLPDSATDTGQTYIDKFFTGEKIAGIEVYPANEPAPARFVISGSTCGTIVIWTR